jgi:ABC-type Fe3+-hydroxamate transport system substrate-binding protein
MIESIDQTGRYLHLPQLPRRIISLVPSITEFLADLGLDEEVAGITKFCIHPNSWFRSKVRIGGTKNFKPERILALEPDLVIANKEENIREQVMELAKSVPVWVSDVSNLDSALKMMNDLGALTGKSIRAAEICHQVQAAFADLAQQPKRRNSVVYLIWKDPYMTIGGDSFIHDMLVRCGFDNLYASHHRYPQTDLNTISQLQPDLLLLASEPYPFSERHLADLQPLLPNTRIQLVNGEYFSWYGSRLLHAPGYFKTLLTP